MITKIVKRYYCEHCRKGGQTKAIARHEESCVKNPNRICAFCSTHDLKQVPLADLLKAVEEDGFDNIWGHHTICPVCMLAVCIQTPGLTSEERYDFDYKEAVKEFYDERNQPPEPPVIYSSMSDPINQRHDYE